METSFSRPQTTRGLLYIHLDSGILRTCRSLSDEMFPEVLAKVRVPYEHLIKIAGRPTTVKTRIIAHSQQMARIDQETDSNL